MGVFKIGKIYYVDYYDASGKRQRYKVGPSKELAKEVYLKKLNETIEEKHLDKKIVNRIKLDDFLPQYLKTSKDTKRPSMYRSEQTSSKHLSKFFGKMYLDEINSFAIENYKSNRVDQKVSNATINRELSCIRTMLNKAVEWNVIENLSVKKIKSLKEPSGRIRYLTKEEMNSLLSVATGHTKQIIIFAVNTGMRKSEILNLKWSDIDNEEDIIHVEQSKTGERRDIPMTANLQRLLPEIPKSNEFVFGGLKYIRRSFETALKRAGIKNFKFHDLRHTFASYLVMEGVSIAVVKELMGHKSLIMTLRYSHLSPDSRKAAIKIFPNFES